MKKILCVFLSVFVMLLLPGCGEDKTSPSPSPDLSPSEEPTPVPTPTPVPILFPEGATLSERFGVPAGFIRTRQADGSFEAFLRKLQLKADGSAVLLTDGSAAAGLNPAAVLDLAFGSWCQKTDALINLRARYLYESGRYSDISFHFMSGFNFAFDKWSEGYTIKVDGSKVDWVKTGEPDNSQSALDSFLNVLYAYTNPTAILSDLQSVADPSPGDVFVDGDGVMIVDMAENTVTGETVVMLCRGGSSEAHSLYIMSNTREQTISPWFSVSEGGVIYTGGESLVMSTLMRFK